MNQIPTAYETWNDPRGSDGGSDVWLWIPEKNPGEHPQGEV